MFLFRVSYSMPFSVVILLGVADTEADEVGAEVCVLVVGCADKVEEGQEGTCYVCGKGGFAMHSNVIWQGHLEI